MSRFHRIAVGRSSSIGPAGPDSNLDKHGNTRPSALTSLPSKMLTRCGLYPCDDARGTRTSSYLPGGPRADSSDKTASGITHDLPYTKFLSTSGVSTTRASVIVTTMDAPQVHFPCFARGSSYLPDTEAPGQHSVCCATHS